MKTNKIETYLGDNIVTYQEIQTGDKLKAINPEKFNLDEITKDTVFTVKTFGESPKMINHPEGNYLLHVETDLLNGDTFSLRIPYKTGRELNDDFNHMFTKLESLVELNTKLNNLVETDNCEWENPDREIKLPVQITTLDRSEYDILGTMLTHKDGTERFTKEINNFAIEDLDNPLVSGVQIGKLWTAYKSVDLIEYEKEQENLSNSNAGNLGEFPMEKY